MLILNKTYYHYWVFIIYILVSIFLCFLILFSSFLLGGKNQKKTKNIPFESGINSIGNARLRFSVKFYLVAIFFVIFDVESLYLYAWAPIIRELGWLGLIKSIIFIFTLLVNLIYIIRINALNWNK